MPHAHKIISLDQAIEIAALANEERYRMQIEIANLKGTQIEGQIETPLFEGLKQVREYMIDVEHDVKVARDEIALLNAQDAITLTNEIISLAESIGVEPNKLKLPGAVNIQS